MTLQTALDRRVPPEPTYQQELARTHYNRGILFGNVAGPDGAFRAARRLPRGDSRARAVVHEADPRRRARTSRVPYNNLAALLAGDADGAGDARTYYDKAIALHEELAARRSAIANTSSSWRSSRTTTPTCCASSAIFPAARQNSARALGAARRSGSTGAVARDRTGRRVQPAWTHPAGGRISRRSRRVSALARPVQGSRARWRRSSAALPSSFRGPAPQCGLARTEPARPFGCRSSAGWCRPLLCRAGSQISSEPGEHGASRARQPEARHCCAA